MSLHQNMDFSGKRRVFVCGDVHGAFHLLDEQFRKQGFDASRDVLIMLGDLVDRGPSSHLAVQYLMKPGIYSIVGNHEVMVVGALSENPRHHIDNGGQWFQDFMVRHGRGGGEAFAKALVDGRPYTMTVRTPGGHEVGLVHGDVTGSWDDFTTHIASGERRALNTAIWGRTRHSYAQQGFDAPCQIAGIDHVFMGHTPVYKILRAGNCSFIDTGACFSDGHLTMIDVDEYMKSLRPYGLYA